MNRMIFICIISLAFFSGCERECYPGEINLTFVGFARADIDTLIIRAYTANDNYSHLLDTVLENVGYASIFIVSNDSLVVYLNSSDLYHTITAGYDWQIYIPAKNRTVRISNIISPQTKNSGRSCVNPINSFEQDGKLIVPELVKRDQAATSGYMVYINNQ